LRVAEVADPGGNLAELGDNRGDFCVGRSNSVVPSRGVIAEGSFRITRSPLVTHFVLFTAIDIVRGVGGYRDARERGYTSSAPLHRGRRHDLIVTVTKPIPG